MCLFACSFGCLLVCLFASSVNWSVGCFLVFVRWLEGWLFVGVCACACLRVFVWLLVGSSAGLFDWLPGCSLRVRLCGCLLLGWLFACLHV